jgi:tRNA(fMet)-specific endonuclease VapC
VPLFDTDTISATLRPRRNESLLLRFAAVPSDEQVISAITYGELLYGALRRERRDLLEAVAAVANKMVILPFDEAAAERFAELRVALERSGQRLDEPDLRIAATALAYDLTLVTGNERHFRRVPGLRVENWLLA